MGPLAVVDERRALRDVTPSAALMRAAEGDDEGSKEFYFFGEMYPTGEFRPTVMAESGKKVVEITYRLDVPVRHDLYEFMTSDLTENEPAE